MVEPDKRGRGLGRALMVRALEFLESERVRSVRLDATPMGEPLYRKVEPTGYSNASQEWLNSAGLLARMNFALQLADNKVPGLKVETADAKLIGSPEFQKR